MQSHGARILPSTHAVFQQISDAHRCIFRWVLAEEKGVALVPNI